MELDHVRSFQNAPIARKYDLFFLALLFVLSFISKLPTLDYPLQGDSVIYAKLMENIYNGKGYVFQEQAFTKYPPLFSLMSVPFFGLLTNPVLALKVSAIFWHSLTVCLTYVFARLFLLPRNLSTLASLLVLFNPWYFYYTGVLSLSESLGIFLVVLGLLLFYLKHHYFSGLIFGLSLITRYTMGVFVIPLLIYYSLPLLKYLFSKKPKQLTTIIKEKGKEIRSIIIMTCLTFLPLLIWIVSNVVNKTNLFTQGYTPEVIRFTEEGIFKAIPFFQALATFMVIILPLIFLGLVFFILWNFIKLFSPSHEENAKDKKAYFWKICFWAFLINILFFSWWISIEQVFFPFIWERIRFIVPFIPVFTLFALTKPLPLPTTVLKKVFSRKRLGFLTLIIFIMLTSLLSFGAVKDNFDTLYPTRDIYTQRSSHQAEAIHFINQNLELDYDNTPGSVIIIGVLSPQSSNEHKNYFLSEHFKESIMYLPVRIDPDEMLKEEVNETLSIHPGVLNQPIYILSEYSLEETTTLITEKTTIPLQTLTLVFATDAEPKVYVYTLAKKR